MSESSFFNFSNLKNGTLYSSIKHLISLANLNRKKHTINTKCNECYTDI